MTFVEEEKAILVDDIPDWNRCFNCAFAKKYKMKFYICRLKHATVGGCFYKDMVLRVPFDGSCEYLITRPKYCAETYGYAVILYRPNASGVKKLDKKGYNGEYLSRLRDLGKKLGIPYLPSLATVDFSWTFSSTKQYALLRNLLVQSGITDAMRDNRYLCESCGNRFELDEVEVHHIHPRSLGGSDTTANLKVLCYLCHDVETWKLIAKETDIPTSKKWRKLIEIKLHLFEDRAKRTKVLIDRNEKNIEFLNRKETTDMYGWSQDYTSKSKKKSEEMLPILRTREARYRRKIDFWSDLELRTRRWKKRTKSEARDLPKFKTIDSYFK